MIDCFREFTSYTNFEPAGVELPKIDLEGRLEGKTAFEALKLLCREGIIEKGINKFPNKDEYYKRAQHELEVLEDLGFSDYILLNWDIIGYCHKHDIPVGEGRGCLSGDSLIRGKYRPIPIKDIKIGDEVLDGFGNWTKVTNKFKYPCNEKMVSFEHFANSTKRSKFTLDHKVLVVKNPFETNSPPKSGYRGYKDILESSVKNIQWVEADKIEKGDYLVRYIPSFSNHLKANIDLSEFSDSFDESFVYTNKKAFQHPLSIRNINKKTKISRNCLLRVKRDGCFKTNCIRKRLLSYLRELNYTFEDFLNFIPQYKTNRFISSQDFFYLLGLYIGDGCSRRGEVSIAIHSTNDFKVRRFLCDFCNKNKISFREDRQNDKNLIRFCITNKPIQKLINQYCVGKNKDGTKKIVFDVHDLNLEQSKRLYKGLLDSDGSISDNRVSFDSVCYDFIDLFRVLYEKIYHLPTTVYRRNKDLSKNRPRDAFKVRGLQSKNSNTFVHKNILLVRVKDKKYTCFDGFVYDFSVKSKTKSYSTIDFSVHNSAAGSLVLYLIGVTGIDPIKYNLFFERFVSKNRAKKIKGEDGKIYLDGSLLADIDNDVSYEHRQQVIEYIENKYKGKTAKILTFNTLTSKACIGEATKYFDNAKKDDVDLVSAMIPVVHGKVAELEKAREEVEEFDAWIFDHESAYANALKIQGLIKNTSVHASGIAISAKPIEDLIPLQVVEDKETKESHLITGYDMNDVSALMVKFDILGLTTLSFLERACKRVGIKRSDIDPEDPFIYRCLQDYKSPFGLFQISAHTNAEVTKKVKPLNLSELSDVVALARPSSLQFVEEYVRQKNNPSFLNLHPELDLLLEPTKNVFLFQETLMQCLNKVFGFSLSDAEALRKSVGKKVLKDIPKWKEKIFKAAKEKGISNEVTDFFWSAVEAACSYAFNKCLGEDTIVYNEYGEPQPISACSIGDKILCQNMKSNTQKQSLIKDIVRGEEELFEFEMEDGRILICSMNHKFLTKETKSMIPIESILKNNYSIIFDKDLEFFKKIINDNYFVSNKGRVFSRKRKTKKQSTFLKPYIDKYGYEKVMLYDNKKRRKYFVHRLVAMAFIENKFNKECVNHKNGNKRDNNVENLEWVTVKENNIHSYNSGLNSIEEATKRILRQIKVGEKHHMSKLKEEDVFKIKELINKGQLTQTEIGRIFNVSKHCISRIKTGKTWSHLK